VLNFKTIALVLSDILGLLYVSALWFEIPYFGPKFY